MPRQINAAGLELVKVSEGLSLHAYHGAADRPGLLTIGYGHTSEAGPPEVVAGMVITKEQAEEILLADLAASEAQVESLVKVPLSDNQFAALVDFDFNLGEGALARSTLLKKLNARDYASVPAELNRWVRASGGGTPKGLVDRRAAEGRLFMSGVNPTPATKGKPMTSPASPPSGGITIPNPLGALNGYKTYLLLAAAAIAIIANHFSPGSIPGMTLDPANWVNDLWKVALGGGFRSALGKLIPL